MRSAEKPRRAAPRGRGQAFSMCGIAHVANLQLDLGIQVVGPLLPASAE